MSPINKYYPIEIEHVLIVVVLPTINNTNPIIVMGIPILYLDLCIYLQFQKILLVGHNWFTSVLHIHIAELLFGVLFGDTRPN